MKLRKKALVVVLCCLMGLTALSGTALAAFYTCSISECGSAGTFYTVTLTDIGGAFTNTSFVILAATPGSKEMLASLLTAWSTGGHALVWLDSITPSSAIIAASCTNN
jgi:hypothetical protein